LHLKVLNLASVLFFRSEKMSDTSTNRSRYRRRRGDGAFSEEIRMNMSTLRRIDPYICRIIESASQVMLVILTLGCSPIGLYYQPYEVVGYSGRFCDGDSREWQGRVSQCLQGHLS